MTTYFKADEVVLKLTTRAITRAIQERLRLYCLENKLETNNHRSLLTGDMINQCLRELLVLEGVRLHPFRRHGWEGRLIVDHVHSVTISVMSQRTLDGIPKGHRCWPHYLQTLLQIINGNYDAGYEQLSFLPPIDAFDDDVYDRDFELLLQGIIDDPDGWHHYVVSYTASGYEVKDVHVTFFDSAFNVIEERSLNEYIEPNSSALIEKINSIVQDAPQQDVHDLVGLKPGIKPPLIELEDEA